MTDKTSLVNLALQSFGSRTTVTAAELAANSTNEAIQANLTYENTRDSLLRLAPWDCALKTANLTYITSIPGTPENTSPATNLWLPGQPRPPYAYEYQYPVDCLRACWIIPATLTGAGGIPITTATTGFSPTTWLGGPIPFKVATDEFLMWTVSTILAAGTGYSIGDALEVSLSPSLVVFTNKIGTFQIGAPQGAPARFVVATVNGAGGVTGVLPINQIIDDVPPRSGSYFYAYQTTPTFTTDGFGVGCSLTGDVSGSAKVTQRVILTNQEYATLVYVKQVTNPNVWDPLFQDAFVNALGAELVIALSGDKALANICINRANNSIAEARKVDGNEGLTINDATPDWIRGRGIAWADGLCSGPYSNFDWGGFLANY